MSRDVILLFEMNPGVKSLLARGSRFQDPSMECQQPQQASQGWKASHGVEPRKGDSGVSRMIA